MLLLFVPEFAPEQFTRLIGDLAQPLFQRFAVFAIEVDIGVADRRHGGLLVAQFTAGDFIIARLRWRVGCAGLIRRGVPCRGLSFSLIPQPLYACAR